MNRFSAAVAHGSHQAPCQDRPLRRSRQRPVREPAAPAVTPPGGNTTILVVGDTPVLRGVLVGVMRRLGYRVLQAAGAIQAQSLVKHDPEIQLIFLDLAMPTATDLQLALWFRATYPGLPVAVASAWLWEMSYPFDHSQEIALLPKPFTSAELARFLANALRVGKPEAAVAEAV